MSSPFPHRPSLPSGRQQIVLAAPCWSCDTVVHRRIHQQLRHSATLVWSCSGCDVSWAGPGHET